MASYPRTLRNGNTPALRAVIDGALAANNVPTASDDQMAGTGDCDHIDLVLLCAGAGGSYSARVWWWNADAELWILDTVIGTINMTTVIGTTRRPDCLSRAMASTTWSGTTPSVVRVSSMSVRMPSGDAGGVQRDSGWRVVGTVVKMQKAARGGL